MYKHPIAAWAWLCLALSSGASADADAIRKSLGERYPGLAVQSVSPSPVPGIWEVWTGRELVYTDAGGDHLFIGTLVDTRGRINLTQQRVQALRAVPFDTLPLELTFSVVKGKGERRLAVFTDPDCPFCRRLERELAQIDNVTVHVFLLPVASLHPNAPTVARDVWCAQDRASAWLGYMLEGRQAPAVAESCQAPLEQIARLAERLGVEGTPALFFGNGRRVDGLIPAREIERLLQAGS
ncbi:MAG: DsbC family protein [Thiobacillaceae bacterium]|nr:DsbC family protein [Thiobacillaceae bacterium]